MGIKGAGITQRVRINGAIRAPKVRLIGENGDQLGVVSLSEALLSAEEAGLDLVEISPSAEPPVTKVMDFGKYKYEQEKKIQKARSKQKTQDVKGIRLSVKIGKHDFDTKATRAKGFVAQGHKLSLVLRFRGREMAHKDLGEKVLKNFVAELGDEVVVEMEPKFQGRSMNMIVAPKKK